VVDGGFENRATDSFGSVAGGCENIAGSGTLGSDSRCDNGSPYVGDFASVGAGQYNQASGNWSAILGGADETQGAREDSQPGSTVFTP